MDKNTQKQIKQFADMLPKIMEPCTKQVLGSALIKEGKTKDDLGLPILPKQSYSVPSVVQRNHYRAMKKIYKTQGEEGLKAYAVRMGQLSKGKLLTSS